MEFQLNFANEADFKQCQHQEFKEEKKLILEDLNLLAEVFWESLTTNSKVDDILVDKYVRRSQSAIDDIIQLPFGDLKTIITEFVVQLLLICLDKGAIESFFQRKCVFCQIEDLATSFAATTKEGSNQAKAFIPMDIEDPDMKQKKKINCKVFTHYWFIQFLFLAITVCTITFAAMTPKLASLPRTCFSCPDKWITIFDTCYFVSTETKTFASALKDCKDKNSTLIEPDDANAQRSIIMYLQPHNAEFTPFLGIKKLNSRWLYESSKLLPSFDSWCWYCPRGGRHTFTKHCIKYIVSENTWIDTECNYPQMYICQKPKSNCFV